MHFMVNVSNRNHLANLLRRLRKLPEIARVERR